MTKSKFGFICSLVLILSAGAAAIQGQPIEKLQIAVEDMATRKALDPIAPGEVLVLEVGQKVRLHMLAIPAGRNRAPRYPSTRFTELAGKARVALSKPNEEAGSALVEGVRPDQPGNNAAKTLIQYELLEDLNIRQGLKKGTITVEVVAKKKEAAEEPQAPAKGRGVIIYEHQDFRGRSGFFGANDPNLKDNRWIGQDKASSIKVDRGCKVTLYADTGYRGRATVLTQDETDLGRTRVGNDSVSSLKIECDPR